MNSEAQQRHLLRLARDAELQRDLRDEQVIEPSPFIYVSTGTGVVATRRTFDTKTTDDERAAIAAYLETKAPRVFPPNDYGDDFNLCVFLRSRGHKVQRHCSTWGRRAPFWIDEKPYTRRAFIDFINRIRAALQMQPLGCAA